MTDEQRNALIEELRSILYNGGTSPRVILREARNAMDRIPVVYDTYIEAGTNDPHGDFITE